MNEKVYAQNIVGLPALHFDYLGDDLSLLNGKNALFINSDKRFKDREKRGIVNPFLKNYFEGIIELEPIIVKKGNKDLRKFWVYLCKNYQFASTKVG